MARIPIGNVYPSDEYLMARCAPAGFGLGKHATLITDLDSMRVCGFFNFGEGAIGSPFPYGGVLLVLSKGTSFVQLAFNSVSADWGGAGGIARRIGGETSWYDWEYLNPPMAPNVEYKTLERWAGKPVYRKLVTFKLTEGTSAEITVPHGINNFKGLVRQFAVLQDKFQLPYMYDGNTTWVSTVNDKNIIVSNTGLAWDSSYSWSFELYYTKTTD